MYQGGWFPQWTAAKMGGIQNMLRYTVKRFLSMLLTLFLVATVTFFLMHSIPGQPFEVTRETPESVKIALEA